MGAGRRLGARRSRGGALRARGPRGPDLDRLELGGEGDLDQLEVVGMVELGVADAGRLVHAGARPGDDLAHPFVVELHPALEHVIHLEVELVLVPAEAAMVALLGADDMGHGAAAGRLVDAEVAVLEAGSQAVALEDGVLGVGCRELELLGGHGRYLPGSPPRAAALAGTDYTTQPCRPPMRSPRALLLARSDSPRAAGPVGIADLVLLDLADGAFGQPLDEGDAARPLVAGQRLEAELDDLAFAHGTSRPQHHVR